MGPLLLLQNPHGDNIWKREMGIPTELRDAWVNKRQSYTDTTMMAASPIEKSILDSDNSIRGKFPFQSEHCSKLMKILRCQPPLNSSSHFSIFLQKFSIFFSKFKNYAGNSCVQLNILLKRVKKIPISDAQFSFINKSYFQCTILFYWQNLWFYNAEAVQSGFKAALVSGVAAAVPTVIFSSLKRSSYVYLWTYSIL